MAKDVESVQLRGLIAQVARAQNKSMSDVTRFDLRALLVAGGYNAPAPPSLQPAILAALKSGPYPTHGPGKITQFSFEFWFNYFFKELPSAELLKFAPHVINDDGTLRGEAQIPNKKVLFAQMLALGFQQFRATDHLTASEIQAHAALDGRNELQREQVNILFRGDGRKWREVQQHQGTMPQTRIQFLRHERNIDKDWHPFNLRGDVVWVRNGEVNRDNCLFSAVSVTPQFGVATKFPLLGDLLGTNPGAAGHAVVTVKDRGAAVAAPVVALSKFQQAQQKFGQVNPQGDKNERRLVASQTNVYVVRTVGAYNTQLYQRDAPFPEYASDNLSWSDHLVWLSVTRIHYDVVDGNAGHQIVINDHRWLQDDGVIRAALLGPNSLAKLQAFVADIVKRGAKENGGIPYTPPGVLPPNFEIVKIHDAFIAGRGKVIPEKMAIPGAFALKH
jgi:hypothetical protein